MKQLTRELSRKLAENDSNANILILSIRLHKFVPHYDFLRFIFFPKFTKKSFATNMNFTVLNFLPVSYVVWYCCPSSR